MKKCYFCKGEIIEKRVRHIHSWADKLILFQQIPAEVCKQCGEVYFSPKVIETFDKATEHLDEIKKTVQVPVVPYSELVHA
ncbi:MAG: YgiT-type zinc finger protein [Candidatus Omnitrophica bacterium]|nr:YgiT-type zinc finger protein [Candidatus Omnitrophota bacterium]